MELGCELFDEEKITFSVVIPRTRSSQRTAAGVENICKLFEAFVVDEVAPRCVEVGGVTGNITRKKTYRNVAEVKVASNTQMYCGAPTKKKGNPPCKNSSNCQFEAHQDWRRKMLAREVDQA